MDSILGDYFINGRRLRSATLEFALLNFPRLIQRLKQNQLVISNQEFVGNPSVIILYNPKIRHEIWTILKSDFDLCRDIAGKIELKTFPGDNEIVALCRISSYIKTVFAGRGVPSGNV